MKLTDLDTFKYILIEKLMPYTEAARRWWSSYKDKVFIDTTCFPMKDAPAGMFEKIVRSPKQSCVYGVQAFPIVAPTYIQNLPSVSGGVMAAIEFIAKQGLIIDEFTLIPKRGLQTTLRNGFFLCYIPTDLLDGTVYCRWVYMSPEDIVAAAAGVVTEDLKARVMPYALNYHLED